MKECTFPPPPLSLKNKNASPIIREKNSTGNADDELQMPPIVDQISEYTQQQETDREKEVKQISHHIPAF